MFDYSVSDLSAATGVRPEVIDHEAHRVRQWRTARLIGLGLPGPLAAAYADRLDWHQIARLIRRGCPPLLALRIVR